MSVSSTESRTNANAGTALAALLVLAAFVLAALFVRKAEGWYLAITCVVIVLLLWWPLTRGAFAQAAALVQRHVWSASLAALVGALLFPLLLGFMCFRSQ
jgi:multisubunit Na+/H+ antiporter MnhG subunit